MKRNDSSSYVFYLILIVSTTFSQYTAGKEDRVVTILFTNDFESAYDPTPAFWREDMDNIGGIAQIASLIDSIRTREPNVFLFDSGDIFTGILAQRTEGEISFELMNTMAYDAMVIGNHEFEYGWEVFARQKNRVPFPVLGANLYYKGTDILYAQPYSIIERNGIRIGVIGVLGQDAATALIPSNIAGVEVRDPKLVVPQYVRLLRKDVDLIVLLTHQGKTAPMQTNDEGEDVKRDINADIELAGVVQGIDVLFGGHADAGTEEPVVQPDTGTLIMQTYGQGRYLGYLKLMLESEEDKIISYEGKLIPVNSDKLPAHKLITRKLEKYRVEHADLFQPIGRTSERFNRKYNRESDIGNLFADIIREHTRAQIAFMPSGGIRKDIPEGQVTKLDLLDAFPFNDHIVKLEMKGSTILEVLEQGLSLERGILQVSGISVHYDMEKPVGERVVTASVNGKSLQPDKNYIVGTIEILAQGGDLYLPFTKGRIIGGDEFLFSNVLEDYFASKEIVHVPNRNRLIAVEQPN